jgi:hypothetical protein
MTRSQKPMREVFDGVATVKVVNNDEHRHSFVLETDVGRLEARRAVSCLVDPVAGDSILYASISDGECYVVAVLERAAKAPVTLTADGDVRMQLPHGRFSVAAQEGIALVSGKDLAMAANDLEVHANRGRIHVQTLSFLGSLVEAEVDRIKLLASSLDSVLGRFAQRVKQSYRFVEERDEVRADYIDYAAEKNACLRGENTIVSAEDIVKIDAKQIIVG